MKVVLDTNVWLSGIFWKGEAYKLISKIESKGIRVIITTKITEEIIEVLNSEAKFQKFIKKRKIAIEELIRTIISMTNFIESKTKLSVITEHPADNHILETAIDGKADYLISYNKHLLNLKKYGAIQIVTPTEFLKKISK